LNDRRFAAIDIGTNSIRCIMVEIPFDSEFKVLDDEKATVRLGEGLSDTGSISDPAWQRAREALSRMKKIADGLGVKAIEAVATSAVRKAANGPEFVAAMAAETGIRIQVIDGEQEAELAALSAWHHFDMASSRYALVDIGGGSAEVVTAVGTHIEHINSLELGAIYLTEKFLKLDPIAEDDLRQLRSHIRKELQKQGEKSAYPVQCLIGSGGTLNAIGGMIMAMRKEQYGSVHGYEVLRSEVVHLLAMLQRKSLKERRMLTGLSPERAEIIVAGVAVVDELMRWFGTNILKINERGIREGLILKSLEKYGYLDRRKQVRDWRTAVRTFAGSCHVDLVHGEQVRELAVALFDALAAHYGDSFGLTPRNRQLLEAAALLHDVGYFIDYAKHHKHSYHLIRHANLFDFTPRETEIIANLARYHRKSLPKKKHENFVRLSPGDQALVCRLGGILRLADGLDRRRSGLVRKLDCRVQGRQMRLEVAGGDDLSVEIYGARTKGDLFEQAFGRRLLITSAEGTYAAPDTPAEPT
jgi:exopolyphosphatase/guanosine-5'-triphosphate,3'-diphosphate pyrophosphatase